MATATLIETTAYLAGVTETAESIVTGMGTLIATTLGDGVGIPVMEAKVVSVACDVVLRPIEFGHISTPKETCYEFSVLDTPQTRS